MADSNNNFSNSFLSGLGSGVGNFAGGLLDTFTGGIFTHRQNKRQERLIREQNDFNAKEAKKQRDWQELMQRLYGTVQAKANQYRAAGLNAQLAGVQSDSVGSGASATASESLPPQNEYNGGLSGLRSVGSDIVSSALSSQSVSSQTSLNKTIEGLNMANKELSVANKSLTEQNTEAARQRVEEMKLNVDFLTKTFSSRCRQQYYTENLALWRQQSEKYNAITQMYSLYNLAPAQVDNLQSSTIYNYANAFRAVADGKMTYTQLKNYGKELAIRQTMAYGSLLQGKAAVTNAETYKGYYGELQRGAKINNDFQNFTNKFWTGAADNRETFNYIKREPNLYKMFRLNLYNNEFTLNKLAEEPDMIRSVTRMNNTNTVRGPLDDFRDWLQFYSDQQPGGSVETVRTERYDRDGTFNGAQQTERNRTTNRRNSLRGGRRRR